MLPNLGFLKSLKRDLASSHAAFNPTIRRALKSEAFLLPSSLQKQRQARSRGEGDASMGVPPTASRSSMAQRLAALEHSAKDDLDAGRRAQAPDPAVLVLPFDVARLILVSASLAPGLLWGGEAPGVREPQPGPGLEPPATQQRCRPTRGAQQGSSQESHILSGSARPGRRRFRSPEAPNPGTKDYGKCSFS